MKKILYILMLSLLLTACGNSSGGDTASLQSEIESLKKENEGLKTEIKTLKEKISTNEQNKNQDKDKEVAQPKKENENIGDRKSPAPLDTPLTINAEYNGVPIEFTITIKNMMRGEGTEERMLQYNQFNEIGENEEIVYFDVVYELNKYAPKDDSPFLVSHMDFDYYKSDYTEYRSTNHTVVNDHIYAKIYEGATAEGVIGLVIPKGDNGYILYNDFIWFKLPNN